MKKVVTVGVAAMSIVGFLGLGATAASAKAATGPDQTAICNAINSSVNGLLTPTANATSTESAALTAFNNATSALNIAITNYGSTLTTWVIDTDANSPNVNVDAVAFQNAYNNLITAITTWSNTRTAEAQAKSALQGLQLQNQILGTLKTQLSC